MTSVEKYRNKLNLKFNYDQLKLNLVFFILLLNPVLNYDLSNKKIMLQAVEDTRRIKLSHSV